MPTSINTILAAGALAAAMLAAGTFRLPSLIRAYSLSSMCLGLFIVGLGIARNEPRFFWLAAISLAIKVIVIPWIILRAARGAGMRMRLSSFARPATSYILVTALVAAAALAAARSPFAADADPGYLFVISVAMFAVGFAMMVLRRDLLSQLTGFLVMENGIAAFSFAAVRDLPFLVEIGFLMTLTAGVVLMGTLSGRVRELYGTESTQALRELSD